MRKLFIGIFSAILILSGQAQADYQIFFGNSWAVTVPDYCELKDAAILCKVDGADAMYINWKIVTEGKDYTQEHHREVALDPEMNAKSVQSMKQRVVEYAKEHKDTVTVEPEAYAREIGQGVWATVGAVTSSSGAYIAKVQIWHLGFGGEITGVVVDPKYLSAWWNIVDSIRTKYMGEN